jgi:hypothetical protein
MMKPAPLLISINFILYDHACRFNTCTDTKYLIEAPA